MQVVQVGRVLFELARPIIGVLVVELVHERVVVPLGLTCLFLTHLVDHFLVFLGAVVRFVVLLAVILVLGTLLTVPVLLLVDEGLVHLQSRCVLSLGLAGLGAAHLQVVVELALFVVTLLLKLDEVLLVALQGRQGSLVSYSHLLLVVSVTVAQRVVVEREGTVRSKEHGHVSVVGLRDLLAVKSLMNQLLEVALRARFLG